MAMREGGTGGTFPRSTGKRNRGTDNYNGRSRYSVVRTETDGLPSTRHGRLHCRDADAHCMSLSMGPRTEYQVPRTSVVVHVVKGDPRPPVPACLATDRQSLMDAVLDADEIRKRCGEPRFGDCG